MLVAAFFYSLVVVRMAGYARCLPAVQVRVWLGARPAACPAPCSACRARAGRLGCAARARPSARPELGAKHAAASPTWPEHQPPRHPTPRSPRLQIATGKSVVLGSLAMGSLALAAAGAAADGRGPAALWEGYADPAAWAALAWAGLGPGAVGSYLHVVGQRRVAPADAQIILSSKPLWAAALAWVLLGGEQLGPQTWAGGAALAAAGLVAATGDGGQAAAAAKKAD